MCAHMCVILLTAAQDHIGLKAVGMAGLCWMMNVINDKFKERKEVRRSEGIHTEACRNLNEDVSRLTTGAKRGIWQCKV